jgi:hypothetical protein
MHVEALLSLKFLEVPLLEPLQLLVALLLLSNLWWLCSCCTRSNLWWLCSR